MRKALKYGAFQNIDKQQKYGQKHPRVGGDAVKCFLIGIVWFARRWEPYRNSLGEFAGIVDLFLLESRPEREKETSAFPLQE